LSDARFEKGNAMSLSEEMFALPTKDDRHARRRRADEKGGSRFRSPEHNLKGELSGRQNYLFFSLVTL
jgi:hypothetical protein